MGDARTFPPHPSNFGRKRPPYFYEAVIQILVPPRAEQDENTWLHFADSLNNRIAAILNPLHRTRSAGTGLTVSTGGSLNDPLGLTVASNGHILVVNGNDGFVIEITPRGKQLAKVLLDNTGGPPPGNGTLFGVTFNPLGGVLFVDDGSNTLNSSIRFSEKADARPGPVSRRPFSFGQAREQAQKKRRALKLCGGL